MRPEILFPFFKNISDIKGVGPKTEKWLKLLCGGNLYLNALFHLPVSIYKRIEFDGKNFSNEFPVILGGKIQSYQIPKLKRLPLKILIETDFGDLEVIYFNYHLSSFDKFPEGSFVWFSGKLVQNQDIFQMIHPDYFTFEKEKIPSFESVYSMVQKVPSGAFAKVVKKVLENIPALPEWLNLDLLNQKKWPTWKEGLKSLHSPRTNDSFILKNSYDRLIFDEFLAHQLALHLVRQYHHQQKGISCLNTNEIHLDLPFQLTEGQKKVLAEIKQDLSSDFPMRRLLQGDVGSGKTIVALLSALQVIASGYQVAFMAPTDILVRQHYQKIKKLLDSLQINLALLTAKEKGKTRQKILDDLKEGKISILIGTHALIEENVAFKNLAYCIVDEQHRFGVNQRLSLLKKQKGCNLLVMSATPIPRSLSMTIYGDMDISILKEKPKGRQSVQTCLMNFSQISSVIKKLRDSEYQAYWVCPLIEENEKSDLAAVQKRFSELQQFFGEKLGLLHGKMKSEEKEQVIQKFQSGTLQILVSTTVVEVGVDVPNACVMVIEQAERFGLATLHQLRGRVGRGKEKAYCLLLHGKLNEKSKERLTLLRETEDGFKIANADLKMRGAGQVLGTDQSGFEEFKMGHLPENQDLLDLADTEAKKILSEDPYLKDEKNKNLHILLYLFEKEKAIMTLKAG